MEQEVVVTVVTVVIVISVTSVINGAGRNELVGGSQTGNARVMGVV